MSKVSRKMKHLTILLVWSGGLVVSGSVFRVKPLPYSYKALEPHLSQEILELHHDNHYRNYVAILNTMLKSIERLEDTSLEEIMLDSYQWNKPLYNQAAQCWNHDFYFKCMTSNYLPPSKSLMERISNDFGSFHRFAIEFRKAGNAAFGSGWAWLVHDATTGELFVTHTIGADNPIVLNEYYRPILAMDVWEHAYYLDYQNRRKDYTATFLKALVDWKFVEENLLRVEAEAKVLAKARLDTRIDDETSKREREMLEAEAVIEAARTERLQREAKSAAEAALREQERADVEAAAEAARVEQARIENEVTETAEHEQERLEAEVIEKDNETCEGQEL